MKKTRSVVKKLFGGKRMKSDRKNILGTAFTLLMFICSMFASMVVVAPSVAAANGLGEVTKFQTESDYPVSPPDKAVITVNAEKDITIWIHNDEPVGGNCIDEIIVSFPDSWQQSINTVTSTVTTMGPVDMTNEKDDGTFSGLESDPTSLRIIPHHSGEGAQGVELCPSGTTEITIRGLKAPANPGDSQITIMTSDEDHNEESDNDVRQEIDDLPVIKVTAAEKLKIEYNMISNFKSGDQKGGATSDFSFTGTGKGAMGRTTELYVTGTGTIKVYLDRNGDGDFDSNEFELTPAGGVAVSGITTVPLSQYSGYDLTGKYDDAYVMDGKVANYFINGGANIEIVGHADEPMDPDPSVVGTGFEGDAVGTVITANNAPVPADGRKIKVQLVREDGGKLLDVKEQGIELYYISTMGTFTEASPEPTDINGESELNLLPETVKGIADVEICFPDKACETEKVGINARAAVRCEAEAPASVEAGDIAPITVTAYDQFGNIITDKPSQKLVTFDLISKPASDAALDDDTNPDPVGSNHEEDLTDLGIAGAYLFTSTTIGDHVVDVSAEGLDCGTVTVTGTLGQADAVECFPVDIVASEITADQCFDVKVYVTDKNGNRLPRWQSLVEISLADTDKTIVSSDLREAVIFNNGKSIKGKLNNNDPAYATIHVCGCDELGALDVMCKSDTLEEDSFELDVINSAPDCIDVMPNGFGVCDAGQGQLTVSVKDTCGNNLVDQECGQGGWATSCVKLESSCGVLSSDKTCVDLMNTGTSPAVDLDLSGCACPGVTVTATDEPDCCEYQGNLPMCDSNGLFIPIIGTIDPSKTTINVYPEALNQQPDQFYVSERTVFDIKLYDECGQSIDSCDKDSVEVELKGEDCVDTSIQVDSPLDLSDPKCKEGEMQEPLYKVVVENCAEPEKQGLEPAWTDIPEKDDIVVDKFAFHYTGSSSDTICIYEETENVVGFDPTDNLWGCRRLDSGDQVKDLGSGNYIIELDTRVPKSKLGEYDNQRMGGAIVRPGDTKDFYFVLVYTYNCEYKDIDYLYFEDYNSPDWIEGGQVIDQIIYAEKYTHRNDDYMKSDPYPVSSKTKGYGFGDTIIYLASQGDTLRAVFRDLVAETVKILVDGVEVKQVTFKPQPATQVVALNHDEPPQMACSDEGYDVNLQVTDGFQNPVSLATKVQLESCLTFPRFLYFKGVDSQEIQVDYWDYKKVGKAKDPRDVCFDMEEFKAGVEEIINELMEEGRLEPSDYLATMFAENTEFTKMLEEIFEDKNVIFEDSVKDEYGHDVVYTDANGQATFRVASDDSSMFNIRWMDTHFRIFTIPVALDADYFDVSFTPGKPYQYDVMALPESGVPADGEQESKILIRKLDACGNPVFAPEEYVTVSVDGSAIISRDFSGANNYDQDVTGFFRGCWVLWPFLEDCSLTVMDDVVETVTVTVEDASGEQMCVGYTSQDDERCMQYSTENDCIYYECIWVTEGNLNQPDSATVEFVGAPRNLKITEIKHSDLIPADGFMHYGYNMPVDSCSPEQRRQCGLYNNPDICFQKCTEYGGSGAWVTVEVQDKYGKRVQGYLGDGLKGDPGDKYGLQDNIFENICVALDDKRAFIDDFTFGWLDLHQVDYKNRIYCGDLAFGKGSVYVAYEMLDKNGQPLDARDTASVVVSVFDKCDSKMWRKCGQQSKPSFWDDECNGQEFNENNLPDSETASKLTPDYGQLDFVAVADRWDINSDKLVVAADGEDYATLTINPENEYMNVRASMEATLQSSLLGSVLESEAIKDECYVEGMKDPLNPTSIIVNTEACSGGNAKIKLSSTQAGTARITVTGSGYGCKAYMDGYTYIDYFEREFDIDHRWEDFDQYVTFDDWFESKCGDDKCRGEIELNSYYVDYVYHYWEAKHTQGIEAQMHLTTPVCTEWGVIPLTPKNIEIVFKQAYQNKIELKEGWNFFSVPKELAVSNDQWSELGLNTLCSASAMWNDAAQAWTAPVPASTVLTPMEGYWCKATSAAKIDVEPLVAGSVYLPPIKAIYPGWNDVGLSNYVEMKIEHALISIDSIYSLILDWVEGLQRYISYANTGEAGGGNVPGTTGTGNMEAGQGYFIRATASGDLAGLS